MELRSEEWPGERVETTRGCSTLVLVAVDLRDLAKRDGASVPFAASFEAMGTRQLRRRGFFDRWKRESEPMRWWSNAKLPGCLAARHRWWRPRSRGAIFSMGNPSR